MKSKENNIETDHNTAWEAVIGLEVHAQLLTKSKNFFWSSY